MSERFGRWVRDRASAMMTRRDPLAEEVVTDIASCDQHRLDDRLSVAMTAAFDRSIDELLTEVSQADIELLHYIAHNSHLDSATPEHPLLAALAESIWIPASTVSKVFEEASGVHRDAWLYLAAVVMRQTLEWDDQGRFILDALGSIGYPEVVTSGWYAPLLYIGRLLEKAREQRHQGEGSPPSQP